MPIDIIESPTAHTCSRECHLPGATVRNRFFYGKLMDAYHFELENGSFRREIASARTFGFTAEIEMLRQANLARGGSLENAIVLTPEGMLNETPLRFADEFVRHKILDIIGDFALLGMPVRGKITAEKSGHAVHAGLMTKLLKTEGAWEIVE